MTQCTRPGALHSPLTYIVRVNRPFAHQNFQAQGRFAPKTFRPVSDNSQRVWDSYGALWCRRFFRPIGRHFHQVNCAPQTDPPRPCRPRVPARVWDPLSSRSKIRQRRAEDRHPARTARNRPRQSRWALRECGIPRGRSIYCTSCPFKNVGNGWRAAHFAAMPRVCELSLWGAAKRTGARFQKHESER